MRLRTLFSGTLLASLACAAAPEKDEDETDAFGDADTDADSDADSDADTDTGGCEGRSPTITSLDARAVDGLVDTETGGMPGLRVQISTSDPDGDLDVHTTTIWWDTDVDGEVGNDIGIATELSVGSQCGVPDAEDDIILLVDGGDLPYETECEFKVVVTDRNGQESEPAFTTAVTPDENGRP